MDNSLVLYVIVGLIIRSNQSVRIMDILNIEVKSPIEVPNKIEEILIDNGARFAGIDKQVDTYFTIDSGRLKLRQGEIENALIYYFRPESKTLKRSVVKIQHLSRDTEGLHKMLSLMHGIHVVVEKTRKIYFIDNIKFHIDSVDQLGSFVEIEAADNNGEFSESYLRKQCEKYIELFNLNRSEFIDSSYSDMIFRLQGLNSDQNAELAY